jgi:hypothetical protein
VGQRERERERKKERWVSAFGTAAATSKSDKIKSNGKGRQTVGL